VRKDVYDIALVLVEDILDEKKTSAKEKYIHPSSPTARVGAENIDPTICF